jgi:hypothetical protein
MEMRQATLSAGMILLIAITLFAQDSRQEVQGLQQFEVTPAELPAGNNAWSVRIVRSGGFAGMTLARHWPQMESWAALLAPVSRKSSPAKTCYPFFPLRISKQRSLATRP